MERVLVVVAHPDDVDFGAAGTVATLAKEGVEAAYCIVTDGAAGGFDPSISRAEIAGVREREQRDAAAEIGVTDVRFLGYPDGSLTPTLDVRRAITRVIRDVRPDVVITQSPERRWDSVYASHPDHRACGEATLDAVYPDSRNPFAFPELLEEGLEPWIVPEVWVMAAPAPDHFVDITDVFERKIAALLRHVSQHPDPSGLPDRIRAWNAANATAGDLPEGRLAETFRKMVTA